MIAKLALFFLLVVCVFSSYNATRARKMAYSCAATFSTEAEINNWTCKYCSEYKLINVLIVD